MDGISAKITSKGQITLPKTVREVLELNQGDEVIFSKNENGVFIEKKKSNFQEEAILNLVGLLINNIRLVTISGKIASGKTRLIKAVLQKCFSNSNIIIIEHNNGLFEDTKEYVNNVNHYQYTDNLTITGILKNHGGNANLIIMDDADFMNSLLKDKLMDEIEQASDSYKVPLVIIKPHFTEKERLELGEHISIETDITKNSFVDKINKISVSNSTKTLEQVPLFQWMT
ncbi:AbrB/MazE/SpoVT family DNA-binding domain-containing protein [Bacillus sonorensis]|uniref:AbrB/MazE/SpoVT family DNA-binding domain-containing protein n=1 Tax=Bacillus subtilis group TaxID=653685 RepID=UPI001FD6CB4E|nr:MULTISPECIES: AbrB/MazE/SpoVT family DNA-binding domain-containing protein [Bacillus subtilis group]MCJ8223688.1 AbrB/MazE/SpoVT family DNA-binding domain-containing protein [Bacillus paralicheniformis]MEC0526247.1 AbrB/MazE/SpoVT family DNA-binding domain-containing protein [Bacillus sonorensis]